MEPFAPSEIPVTGEQLDGARKAIEYGLACRHNTANRPCPPGWDPVIPRLDAQSPLVVYKAK